MAVFALLSIWSTGHFTEDKLPRWIQIDPQAWFFLIFQDSRAFQMAKQIFKCRLSKTSQTGYQKHHKLVLSRI